VLGYLEIPFDCDDRILDEPVSEDDQDTINSIKSERINKRIPIAYLINKAWFCGLEFYVDERVLIPRSPIAELIEDAFVPWVDPEKVSRLLEIGTGSGCIAIACAYAFPDAQVFATDIDKDCLAIASRNVIAHEKQGQVTLIESDVFKSLDNKQYDIIISNPPYVASTDIENLPAEYAHEPLRALQADDDGLKIVRDIIFNAERFLADDGVLIVEVGNSKESLSLALPQLPFVWLEFAHGGDGVFLLKKEHLNAEY
jgi:ribosomal protein L3 glutamine methyltransferase